MTDLDCPHCGAISDAATNAYSDDGTPPVDGDVSACLHCGGLAVFTGAGLNKRKPTPEEVAELMAIPDIARVSRTIRRFNATTGRVN